MITPEEKRRMVREDERHFLHNQFFRLGLLLIILVPLVWVSASLVRHALRQRTVEREVEAARQALAAHDSSGAMSHLDKALEADPMSPAALEMAGDLAERHRSSEYLRLRLLLDQALPKSTHAKLKLVCAAVSMGAPAIADDALARVPEADRKQPDYLAAVAARALAGGDADAAVAALENAVARASEPTPYLIELAEVLVGSGRHNEAELLLNRLAEVVPPDSPQHTQWMRIRRDYCLAQGQFAEAVATALAMLEAEGSVPDDRRRTLDALCGQTGDARAAQLAAVIGGAGRANDIRRLALHLLTLKPAATLDAVHILLPPDMRDSPHAMALAAASLVQSA